MADLSYTVIIPTLNARADLGRLLPRLHPHHTLFIDSSSQDGTIDILAQHQFPFVVIPQSSFNHGATRNLCLEYCHTEFVIFLTQDACPATEDWVEQLLAPFADSQVAATYARQLPRLQATVLEAVDRYYKYPEHGILQSTATYATLGSRTFFLSNSCAAYRLSLFQSLAGFPTTEIMGEDALFAIKAIEAGYSIIYTPAAQVYHSHHYDLGQLFRRYFDTGVYRRRTRHLLPNLAGQDHTQGSRYLNFAMAWLISHGLIQLIPQLLLQLGVSYLGYKLGSHYTQIPLVWRKKMSMHGFYWSQSINLLPQEEHQQ